MDEKPNELDEMYREIGRLTMATAAMDNPLTITLTHLLKPNMSHKKALQQSIDSTKVEYRQLGNSGLRVSVPILGAMSLGDPSWHSWVLDEAKALPMLKAAYDRGLNTWDTANVYSNGISEIMIGKTIKKFNLPRNKLVLLSKCFGTVGEEPGILHIRSLFQTDHQGAA